MPRLLLTFAVGAMLCAAAVPTASQQIGASRTVLGTVVDNRNRPIIEFSPDDFVVREMGQPREVLAVRVADYPIAVVLDNGSGSATDFDAIRRAAARFIGRVGHRPIAVAVADPPRLIATFDDDRAAVAARVEALTAPSQSAGGLFQTIVNSARAIQETGTPFSAVVVMTGGTTSPIPDEFLTPILESGAAVHVVVNRRPVSASGGPPDRSTETLRALADQTRGQFTTIYTSASYQVALEHLADRMATEIMIEYLVPSGSSTGNDVRLGIRIPGAKVNGLGVSSR